MYSKFTLIRRLAMLHNPPLLAAPYPTAPLSLRGDATRRVTSPKRCYRASVPRRPAAEASAALSLTQGLQLARHVADMLLRRASAAARLLPRRRAQAMVARCHRETRAQLTVE